MLHKLIASIVVPIDYSRIRRPLAPSTIPNEIKFLILKGAGPVEAMCLALTSKDYYIAYRVIRRQKKQLPVSLLSKTYDSNLKSYYLAELLQDHWLSKSIVYVYALQPRPTMVSLAGTIFNDNLAPSAGRKKVINKFMNVERRDYLWHEKHGIDDTWAYYNQEKVGELAVARDFDHRYVWVESTDAQSRFG